MSLPMLKSLQSSVEYLLRYLVWYVDYCCLVPKGIQKLPARSLGLVDRSSPKLQRLYQKLCHLSPQKRNCDIWIHCEMPACWIKVILQILPKISCHGNVSKGEKKRSESRKFTQIGYLSFGEKIVKIGPGDREIICVKLKKKKLEMRGKA